MIGDVWDTISGWVSGGWDGPLPVIGALAGVWWQTGGRSGRRRKNARDLLALYNELPEEGWSAEKDLLERRLRGEIAVLGLKPATEQPVSRVSVRRVVVRFVVVLAAVVAAAAFIDQLGQIVPNAPVSSLQVARGVAIGLAGFAMAATLTAGFNQIADRKRAEQARQLREAFLKAQDETAEQAADKIDKRLGDALS